MSSIALTLQDLYVNLEDEGKKIEYVNYWKIPGPNLIKDYIDRHEIKTNCHVSCQGCQITHIEKYKARYPDKPSVSRANAAQKSDLAYTHPFQIKCKTIPSEANYLSRVHPSILQDASEADLKIIEATMDPVKFGQHYFKWKARKHQEISLRCDSKKKVLRWGRRAGKSESFAIEILWNIFTRQIEYEDDKGKQVKGARVLVVAPYESQVSEIFDKIANFLNRSEILKAEMVAHVKTPYHKMVFSNGAEIRGFTTGAHEAESLRGQDADIMFLDEGDYMSEGDYKTILPIANSKPYVPLRIASTPSGRREHYYNWCENDPQWKEFYFPTPVIDMTPIEETKISWPRMRRDIRNEYSKDSWLQEVMALFIAMDAGVYQPEFVAKAMEDYSYDEIKGLYQEGYYSDWKVTLGIDWNSNAGTWISAIGYNPRYGFKVFSNENVPKQGFTQLEGLRKITEMIDTWKPIHVYVDSGHGATQYEMLRLWADRQEVGSHGFKIRDNIKKYEFGGAVEIRDPVSNKIVKHPAKAYLVENSVRKFEDQTIKFSKNDDVLRKQLLNYIVKSRSESGKPIYDVDNKSVGDHCLDAFNLALVAFAREESIFAPENNNPVTSVGIIGSAMHLLRTSQKEKNNWSEKDARDIASRFGFKNLSPVSSDPEKENFTVERPTYFNKDARQALYAEVESRTQSIKKRYDLEIKDKRKEESKVQVTWGMADEEIARNEQLGRSFGRIKGSNSSGRSLKDTFFRRGNI